MLEEHSILIFSKHYENIPCKLILLMIKTLSENNGQKKFSPDLVHQIHIININKNFVLKTFSINIIKTLSKYY